MPPSTADMGDRSRRSKKQPKPPAQTGVPSELSQHFGYLPVTNDVNYGTAYVIGLPFLHYCEAIASVWAITGTPPRDSAAVYRECAAQMAGYLYDPFTLEDPEWRGLASHTARVIFNNKWSPSHPYTSFVEMIAQRQGLGAGGDFRTCVTAYWEKLVEADVEHDLIDY